MHTHYIILLTIGTVVSLAGISSESFGQPNNSVSVNITESLLDMYPFVSIEYETSSMIVLKGDEDSLLLVNGTLAPLWEAVDKMSKAGYVLEDVTSSGMGSQGNPTRFYAIMVK